MPPGFGVSSESGSVSKKTSRFSADLSQGCGYSLDSGFQGWGHATEALIGVVRPGFEDLGSVGSGRRRTPGTRSPGRCSSGRGSGERSVWPWTGPSWAGPHAVGFVVSQLLLQAQEPAFIAASISSWTSAGAVMKRTERAFCHATSPSGSVADFFYLSAKPGSVTPPQTKLVTGTRATSAPAAEREMRETESSPTSGRCLRTT